MADNEKGLTLIEILVTIAVLGIVATLSTPTIASTFENMQKDGVLDDALQIERAAETYCIRGHNTCEIGEDIPSEVLEDYLKAIDDTYTYTVKRIGTRSFAVHYATENGYSFPYDEEGKLLSKEYMPSSGSKDMVHKPATFENNDSGDSSLDFPSWQSGTHEVGDRIKYDGKVFEIRHGGGIYSPPDPSNLSPYGPFQEVEIGSEFRSYNTYSQGDTVTYDGLTYEMNHAGGNGQTPDSTFAWNALTSVWHPTNDYAPNDTVSYEGYTYKAHHGGANGIEPGSDASRGVWQNISSDEWVSTNIYHSGDQVNYNGVTYEAKWYTDHDEPGNSNVWSPVQDEDDVSRWNNHTVYQAGDRAKHGRTVYEAQWYTIGDNPNQNDGPYEVWQPVE